LRRDRSYTFSALLCVVEIVRFYANKKSFNIVKLFITLRVELTLQTRKLPEGRTKIQRLSYASVYQQICVWLLNKMNICVCVSHVCELWRYVTRHVSTYFCICVVTTNGKPSHSIAQQQHWLYERMNEQND
jgi:hypothetical protein